MLKKFIITISCLAVFMAGLFIGGINQIKAADDLSNRLKGRILLQVEENGEEWYLNPVDLYRYYLGSSQDIHYLVNGFGLGISNHNLNLIPIGFSGFEMPGPDSDNDGLSDSFEQSQGTNKYNKDTDGDGYLDQEEIEHGYSPLVPRPEKLYYDQALIDRLKGRFLLQVESFGEAWYVNPVDGKRYFLDSRQNYFKIMSYFNLGISNVNLSKIPYLIGPGY